MILMRKIIVAVNIALIAIIYFLIQLLYVPISKLIGPAFVWIGTSIGFFIQTFAAKNHDPLRQIPID